jgi:hypothetical protein
MEEHELDLNIEQMMEEMRYKMYEIDTIKDAIVAQQRAVIETLKGRLDHFFKIQVSEEDQERFLLEKNKLESERSDLEFEQANFEVEKEYYRHLLDEANAKAASEKERSSQLASALYKLKLEMTESIKSLDKCLDKDIEEAISCLQRVRTESSPYSV